MNQAYKVIPCKWRNSKNGKAPYQGQFIPGNTGKYKGDANKVIFRSGMELRLMKHLDSHPGVLSWQSEEIAIPYLSPKDGQIHRYFVDFLATIKNRDGSQKTYMIEVKESTQTKMPKLPKTKRRTRRYIRECKTFEVNDAKWSAAKILCKQAGWEFIIMTEKQLRY